METSNDDLQLQISGEHLRGSLAAELYPDSAACTWEIVRNAAIAQMISRLDWQPGVGRVDITFETDFPLGKAARFLVVLDHGRGLTPEDLKRYSTLGPSAEDLRRNPRGGNGGASQKRLGRFAAIALNKKCVRERDPESGYFAVTRATQSGPVKVLSVIPSEIERKRAIPGQVLDSNAPELGFLKGIKGTFMAVVIPNPVYETAPEIRKGLEWRLPRKRGQSFKLYVCGQLVSPPALASRVVAQHGEVEIFADIRKANDPAGMWFTDKESGLRVAEARRIAFALPHPYDALELTGDIFVPNLLANQDTSRGGLSAEYLKSGEWRWGVLKALALHSSKLRSLLGLEEGSTSPMQESLTDVTKLFNNIFGPPETDLPFLPGAVMEDVTTEPKSTSGSRSRGEGLQKGTGVPREGTAPPAERKRPMGTAIRIENTTYVMSPNALDPRIFAEVDNTGRMWVNMRGYALIPTTKEAKREHVISCLLMAVAEFKHADDMRSALMWVGDRRAELQKKK